MTDFKLNDSRANEIPSIAAVINQAILNTLKDLHTCLPAQIISFDPANQTATVQPQIKRVFVGGNAQDLPPLINVPVWQPRAGGFCVTLPIKTGDQCLVIFAERAIDQWFKSGKNDEPKNYRTHSLSDGIALVGMSAEPNAIQNYDPDNLTIRNEDNDQFFKLHANKDIELSTGNLKIYLENASDIITATAPAKIILDTPLAEITGNATIAGDLTVSGSTTLTDPVTANGKAIDSTHKHLGVTPGGGISGVPQ